MKTILLGLVAVLVVWGVSCSRRPGGEGAPAGAASGETDLRAAYREKLREVQALNEEMTRANERGDFASVNAVAREALVVVEEARGIARRFESPQTRAVLLADLGKITGELEYFVRVTGG